MDKAVEIRFEMVERLAAASEELSKVRWAAHVDMHSLISEALAQARKSDDTWRENANEWRQTFADFSGRYASVETLNAFSNQVNARLDALDRTRSVEEGSAKERHRASEIRMWMIGIAIGLLSVFVNVLLYLVAGRFHM
jgi:hypothetical protein